MNARQLITDVLMDIKVLGPGDDLQAEDATFCLRLLNQWIDSLGLEPLSKFFILRTVKALASGTPSYTIGSGGDINIVRPTEIDSAALIIDNTADPVTEIPVEVLTHQRWQAIPQKDLESGLVRGIRFDHGWTAGLGRVYLYPVPNVGGLSLVLYTQQGIAQFGALGTEYTFPPGYELFFRTNFAEMVAGSYSKALTFEQSKAATRARKLVKRSNSEPEELTVDSALRPNGSSFDYRTGENR